MDLCCDLPLDFRRLALRALEYSIDAAALQLDLQPKFVVSSLALTAPVFDLIGYTLLLLSDQKYSALMEQHTCVDHPVHIGGTLYVSFRQLPACLFPSTWNSHLGCNERLPIA